MAAKKKTATKTTQQEQDNNIEFVNGSFICGWAEYRPPTMGTPLRDEKGRITGYKGARPAKILTRMMVELEDGSCVPVYGDHFVPIEMNPAIKGAFKVCFPGLLEEVRMVASEKAYKPGDPVKLRQKVFEGTGNVVYDEVE